MCWPVGAAMVRKVPLSVVIAMACTRLSWELKNLINLPYPAQGAFGSPLPNSKNTAALEAQALSKGY